MTLAPVRDLRPLASVVEADHLPSNVEAEQALLGCLLYDNAAFERLGDRLKAEHFLEPLHERLFAAIETALRKGQLAEPILLAERFANDPAFAELGGLSYLAALVEGAPPAPNAPEYARVIYDLALRRELIRFSEETAFVAKTGEGDLSGPEQVEQAEAALYALVDAENTSQGFQSFATIIRGAVDMAAQAFQRDGGLSGLSTGLIDLDQKIGGAHPSDLMILAARPSQGKTSLATNIAWNVASRYAYEAQPDGAHKTTAGGRVGFFSLEMSGEQLGLRILGQVSGVSSDRLRKGEIRPDEFGRVRDAAIEIEGAPLYTDATGGISLPRLATRARRLKRRHGLDLIIVDYIQLMTSGMRTENRVAEITAITTGLKALAKELNVPILALSQLSRAVEQREDKRPQLSDLRESGSIEQDADMVMFIYRESYYLERLEPREGTPEHVAWREKMDAAKGLADLIIGKQRHGPIGTVRLSFNDDLTLFGNLSRDRGTVAYGGQPLDFSEPRGGR
jgi:replicative DNA helicase